MPLTSNTARIHPFQVLVPAAPGNGLAADSKAQAEQVRALDPARFVRRVGTLDAATIAALDAALAVHLGLER